MKTLEYSTSTCRHCRHYELQGRRGGHCQKLGTTISGQWQACSLYIPPFLSNLQLVEAQAKFNYKPDFNWQPALASA